MTIQRITVAQIKARKGGNPIVSLTAYHAAFAAIADNYCDFLLVGDSVGMVVYGMDTTLSVKSELMIAHGKAVVQGSKQALVVLDMPFGTYEESPEQAFRNAVYLIKETGCGALKLEGGVRISRTVRFLVERGIPVMGHIGLTPQMVKGFGGFKIQGKDAFGAKSIEEDGMAIEAAGAFALVVEGVVESLAARITDVLKIPTIGIGASSACDGQILVVEDMLGISRFVPKFVRRYASVGTIMDEAFKNYANDVRARKFPSGSEIYR
ncbi:MAG: 3-methyl-2-oxobutanoate hydroxymethyltransferase [Candidatus Tokpelaia sp. JSC161]|jgi:3-methyl-2-oxobutanoate hydroxymethyltransferase|nr:MAG: 3-methyl-2-oxobutanoate hydroxymethyltransferase [Candidatus Tokpelaia sp. JSC161]